MNRYSGITIVILLACAFCELVCLGICLVIR